MDDARNAYLNGRYLPLAEARISPLDRGFLFADGVYEVIPVYARRPFRLEQHLARLQHSCDGVGLANPHSTEQWRERIATLIGNVAFADQQLYLQVTRGADSKRELTIPADVGPTVFMFTMPLAAPSAAQRADGIPCISAPDLRWSRCDLKTIGLLANAVTRQQAVAAGCVEAIMLRDGWLTEGTASNVFIARDGVVLAPPKDHRILPGITYDVVFELAAKHGLAHAARPISEAELRTADEIWITSSSKEILPVCTLDGRPVGRDGYLGRPGPLASHLHQLFRAYRDALSAAPATCND